MLTQVNCNVSKILIMVLMEFIAPQAGEYFARIAEPETTKDTRKINLTNYTDLIAY